MFLQKSTSAAVHVFKHDSLAPDDVYDASVLAYVPAHANTPLREFRLAVPDTATSADKSMSVEQAFVSIVNHANQFSLRSLAAPVPDKDFFKPLKASEGIWRSAVTKPDAHWTDECYVSLVELLLLRTTMDNAVAWSLCRFITHCSRPEKFATAMLPRLQAVLDVVDESSLFVCGSTMLYLFFVVWLHTILNRDSSKADTVLYIAREHNPMPLVEKTGMRIAVTNTLHADKYKYQKTRVYAMDTVRRNNSKNSYYMPAYRGDSKCRAVSDIVIDVDNALAFYADKFVLYLEGTREGKLMLQDVSKDLAPKGPNPFAGGDARDSQEQDSDMSDSQGDSNVSAEHKAWFEMNNANMATIDISLDDDVDD
jgi:hypothetical protein